MHPTDQKFEQIERDLQARLNTYKTNPLNDIEKGQMAFWAMARIKVTTLTLERAFEESERRAQSTKLKDRFLRIVNGGYLIPNLRDPEIIRAVRAEMLEEYDDYTRRLTASADVKAQIEVEKKRMGDEAIARQERLAELQAIADKSRQLEKPLQVKRPLSLKNK